MLFAFGLSFPRGESPTPTTVDRRVDCLQRVVGGGEVAAERRPRRHSRRRGELRPPERRLVRLVADDELPHLRVRLRERGDVGGEERRGRRGPPRSRAADTGRRRGRRAAPRRARSGSCGRGALVLDDQRLARLEADARSPSAAARPPPSLRRTRRRRPPRTSPCRRSRRRRRQGRPTLRPGAPRRAAVAPAAAESHSSRTVSSDPERAPHRPGAGGSRA